MLLFAHLLKQNDKWRDRTIRIMRVVNDEAARSEVQKHLEELAITSRIEAEAEVFVSEHPQHVIAKQSKNSAVVFLGFEMPNEGFEAKFFKQMERMSDSIPRVLFVNSIGNMTLES